MITDLGQIEHKHPRPAIWQVVAVCLYLLAGGVLVFVSRHQINPDGIAYARLAEHYAHGRFDLAVASYWGPLLAWLLTPAAWFGGDPILAAKILGIFLGLGFAFAAVRLTKALGAGRYSRLTLIPALLLALTMLPEPVTPDLLLACLLTWYLLAACRLLLAPTPRAALAAGLLGGLAYLAKSYALPFVAVHLCLTLALAWWGQRRTTPRPAISTSAVSAVAGLVILAGPWIAVISHHDGVFTIGSADRLAEPFIVACKDDWRQMPALRIQPPRAGRMSVWESPAEIPEQLLASYRLSGSAKLDYRLTTARANLNEAWTALREIDLLGLLVTGALAALLLACLGRRMGAGGRRLLLWGGFSAALYVLGYVPLLVEKRYFWPVWGLLAALTVQVISALAGELGQRALPAQAPPAAGDGAPETPAAAAPSPAPRWRRLAAAIAFGLLVLSVGWAGLNVARDWAPSNDRAREAAWVRQCAQWLATGNAGRPWVEPGSTVVANHWLYALYTCYWDHTRLLGAFQGESADQIAAELSPCAPDVVLIFDDPELAGRLKSDQRFSWQASLADDYGGRTLHVLCPKTK